MKTYKTQSEVDMDLVGGNLTIKDDVEFLCDIKIKGVIKADNIKAYDIKACDIDAYNIDAYNIDAYNIDAYNIYAYNIDAGDINYYAFCIAYKSITCRSHKGRRNNCVPPMALDGEVKLVNRDKLCSPKTT